VRELRGVLEYAFVVAESGLITPSHLPPKLSSKEISPTTTLKAEAAPDSDEKDALVNALRTANGNQSQAATLLGVSRVTVWHRMKKYGIDVHKLVTH
jgi:two-component system response regulator HydG